MTDLQGSIYQVTPASRGETWEEAYRREIQASRDAYEARYGWPATHVQLPSCIDPVALDLNGLQVTKEHIGRGSLALWGIRESEPDPPPDNGTEGVYVCPDPVCQAEVIDPDAAECWACGFDGRKE